MPIYEYRCDRCGEVHEARQRMSDPPLTDCPSGDGGRLSKIFSVHNVGSSSTALSSGWRAGGCPTPEACGPEAAAMCGVGNRWN